MKLNLASFLLMMVTSPASVASVLHGCPLPTAPPLTIPVDASSPTSLSTAVPSSIEAANFVCLLSLLVGDTIRKPVARSYGGRSWEVQAGPFAESLAAPVCSESSVSGVQECTLALPVAKAGTQYILTSYEYGGDARVEAARFLEQSTFGASLDEIDALASTANSTSTRPNFASWLTAQMSPTIQTSHRAFFRQHLNSRFEYPYYGASPAGTTPCDITSRWRTFALTEQDGIVSLLTNQDKYLHIEYSNSAGRYIWYVEGMARTSTSSLGYFQNVDGGSSSVGRLQVNVAYKINCGRYDNDLSKYSCVGCPVRLCRWPDNKCDYIENPAVDARGIEGYASRMDYAVVDLPEVNSGSGEMVGIDDAVEYPIMTYKKTGDEFWLNATIDQEQCNGMPDPRRPQKTKFNEANFNMYGFQHMESALPTIMGRAFDSNTGQTITLAFDPIYQLRTNTVEEPLEDGGGSDYLATQGWYDGFGWYNHEKDRYDQPINDGAVHCANVRRSFLNEDGCKLSFSPTACTQPDNSNVPIIHNGQGVVVCGSPGETSNNFLNGVVDGFVPKIWGNERGARREIYKDGVFTEQKYSVWMHIALRSKDQLRQRVAWALYQILPIGAPGGFDKRTETWTAYYDIYVKHAFGNYWNVLKELSFTTHMANWLSFRDNASIQYALDGGNELYPDENYAREIMQLFSIGLFKLNLDGTRQTDSEGNFVYTYDSDDIMSYARAWTGLTKQAYLRGNTEDLTSSDRVDPLTIDREKRDVFPKTDLKGGYIGDGFPLCSDLPPRTHLRKGATYLVLGSNSKPEQQWEDPSWGDSNVPRLELDSSSSPLHDILCGRSSSGTCTYPGKVVLEENLVYDTSALRSLAEHSGSINEVRTVRVTGGSAPVFYEYIKPPCVHKNFFDGAKKVISGSISPGGVVSNSLCADPNGIHAAGSCCTLGDTAGNHLCNYAGERMNFASAVEKCMANGYTQCDPHSWASSSDTCTDSQTYSWSSSGCQVRAKISFETSQVARVDFPDADSAGHRNVKNFVRDDTINFFRVPWVNQESLPSDSAECDALQACYSVADGCVCDTTTTDSLAFTTIGSIGSKQDILNNLRIGATDPTSFDAGVYTALGECVPGVQVYSKSALDCGHPLDQDAIFVLEDAYGEKRNLKNSISTVYVSSTSASFRNPVHFIDFMNRNLRDMFQETDAVLDSYFYHPSHAPFMALRFLQRFGISNPSPAYIERVSIAFITGSFGQFGSGNYGDLGAMVAAVLLDDESRQVVLDADQTHGHLREPLLKVFGLLRAMEAGRWAPMSVPMMFVIDEQIGQGPYKSPSVFSFFKPEFKTAELLEVGLVAPESEVLTGAFVTRLLDGMWSMTKYGIVYCEGGFQERGWGVDCPRKARNEGVPMDDATAIFTYEADSTASLDAVLSELALMLTAGRLSESNRIIVRNAMQSTFNSGDLAKAVRIAVQLIASSPEYHSTNVARKTGLPMQLSGYTSTPPDPYKAIVYYYMAGGADSFNLLVPRSNCRDGRDVYTEYKNARGNVGLSTSSLLDIDATGSNQVCDTFAVNKNYAYIHQLYNTGKALFVANAGVLNKPLTKNDNYGKESKVQLFAHNHMMSENQKCDINDNAAGTGVGGRILDMLARQGYHTSSNSVDAGTKFLKGYALDNNPVWSVPVRDTTELDKYSSVGSNMLDLVKNLNSIGLDDDGFLGSTWSTMTSKALFEYEKSLEYQALFESPEFSMDHYPFLKDNKLHNRFRAMAQYMKMRGVRKVNREVFIIQHNGFDSHSESLSLVNEMFKESNDAIETFIEEMKRQLIWENVVIVMASDFGRSISPNSNGGTDHAWGGNYFLLGGSLKGKQILGKYPEHLSKDSDQWIKRGRIIPTTPWEYVWHGVAQWMGVLDDSDLQEALPNMNNFRKCDMFTDQDLFVDGQVSTYDCANMDEDNDGIVDDLDLCPGTLQYFVENGQVDENGCSPDSLPPSTSLSPTSSPIAAPTTSPTLTASPTSSTLPFQDIGNNGSPAEVFPLGKCQGDCDNDGECQEGLVCFQRSNFELVPGCDGGDFDQNTDYCFKPIPTPPPPTTSPTTKSPSSSGSFYAICGGTTSTCSGELEASPSELHDVRCCSDISISSWSKASGCDVWATSFIGGECQSDKTWDEAEALCTSVVGGRLCTKEELLADCTSGTGCLLDAHHIWTATPVANQPTDPTVTPTAKPTGIPTSKPTDSPTAKPTPTPTSNPTTAAPTTKPTTASPTLSPSKNPTKTPTTPPTNEPTPPPTTGSPTPSPSKNPTKTPTPPPTNEPTPPPTTGSPTTSPTTASPTTASPTSSTLLLQYVGNGGIPAEVFPLGKCLGDCDNDGDCQEGLVCFQRGNYEAVPGCHGEESNQSDDFCFSPTNYLWHMGNNGSPASAFPLNNCEGDCDNDSDCAAGLTCLQRVGSEAVPGCDGPGEDGKDYCYYPGPAPTGSPIVSTAPPTNEPTPPPTTGNPTTSPTTASPTTASPTSSTLLLQYVGNGGIPAEVFPLGRCLGDCDRDSDCQEGLVCFQRGNYEAVPGCHGEESNQSDDFCFSPTNYLWHMGNNGSPASAFPLNNCEGDCDNDSDCAAGLTCLQRVGSEAVPGCDGPGEDGKDYCYYPGPVPTGSPIVSTAPPTNEPTPPPTAGSPTTSPTTSSPTTASPTSSTLLLQYVGNGGIPAEVFPLGRCLGDCDNDGDCQEGLVCFQRGNYEAVPGCHGEESNRRDDFCFSPTNYLWHMGNNGSPASAFPLNNCEGDCDNDSDCAAGLTCLQRVGSEAVPGCDGPGEDGKDYCYNPNNA